MLVTPTSGVTGQTFTYQVVYTDADNNAPTGGGYIRVIIPGEGTFNMNKLYAADVDYTDGCVYTYQYQFATNNTYSANFTCSDGYHVVTTNAITGPVVALAPPEENDWPFLTNLEATPAAGNSGTTYRFSVRYFDLDNDAPTVLTVTIRDPNGGNYTATMTATPPADTNYVDGRNYHHDNSTLDIIGVYWYRFTFNDSQHEIVSPWIIGPEVTPFFNLNPATLVLPANGSSRANGSATFTWNSLELPCGAVTYTWQLSSRKDFATIVTQNTSIAETATQTSYVQDLQMPAGKYYWRVRASFGGFTQDWSGIFEFTLTRNDFAPVLSNGFVNPTIGTSLDTFTFYVTYTDADNNAPSYVRVYINGTLHAMSKAYDDSVYSDGCIYTFSTASLVVAAYPYRFTFNCSDGTRLGSIGPFTGPTVAAPVNHAPVLVSPNVDPGTGHTGTTFTFLVTYIDIDGDAPSSITVTINSSAPYALSGTDAGDTDVTDGKIYGYSGTLPSFGTYQFRFNASDGSTAVATGWITGPVLVPFPPSLERAAGLYNYVQTPGYGFSWIDATGGTRLTALAGWDDLATQVTIPFSFPFYDYTNTQIYVCTNGYLSIPGYNAWSNPAFPTNAYNLVISPFWDDLRCANPSNIFTFSPDPSTFVVEWNNYYTLGGQLIGSFQVVLHESGDIVFNYQSTQYTAGGYTTGLNYGYNTAYYNAYTGLTPATTNFAILYRYPTVDASYKPTLVSPAGGATLTNGTRTFTWNSLSLPYNVNYTWQLSRYPDFSTILLENASIPEAGATTSLTRTINLGKGTYYWRVRATYGAWAKAWSDVRNFTINWNSVASTGGFIFRSVTSVSRVSMSISATP